MTIKYRWTVNAIKQNDVWLNHRIDASNGQCYKIHVYTVPFWCTRQRLNILSIPNVRATQTNQLITTWHLTDIVVVFFIIQVYTLDLISLVFLPSPRLRHYTIFRCGLGVIGPISRCIHFTLCSQTMHAHHRSHFGDLIVYRAPANDTEYGAKCNCNRLVLFWTLRDFTL